MLYVYYYLLSIMSTFSIISQRADEPTGRGAATTAACLFGPPADSGQAEFSASALIPI